MKIIQFITVAGIGSVLWVGSVLAEPEWEVKVVKLPPGADDGLQEVPLRQRFILGPVTNSALKAEILLVQGDQRQSLATVPVVKNSISFWLQLPSADFNRVQVNYAAEKGFASLAQPLKQPVVAKRFAADLRHKEDADILLAVLKCDDGSAVSVVCRFPAAEVRNAKERTAESVIAPTPQ